MRLDEIRTALAEVRTIMAGGLDLGLIHLDLPSNAMTVAVVFDDADCQECVMPPEVLTSVVAAELRKRLGDAVAVTVHDPRLDGGPAPSRGAGELVVVDPTGADLTADDPGPGPDAGGLDGKVVGIRVDVLWRSWDWVIDEWSTRLRELGAEVVLWRRAQGLDRGKGAEHHDAFARFLDGIDVAIVGLANCGSCTSWTIKDAVAAADRNTPTVAVATAHFESLAHSLSELYGRPSLRVHVLPYPLDVLPEADVREIARTHFDGALDVLGVQLPARARA